MTHALPLIGGERLIAQMQFLIEIDRLKNILRQTPITDGSRKENTAEHSWHLALCATVLAEHANEPVDVSRVVELLLVHDLVEIDAGDTFIYSANDPAVAAAQEVAETRAAERIFGLLPPEQGALLRSRWDEFEAKQTPEAKFAKSVDRVQPMLLNLIAGGGSWAEHGVTADKTRRLIDSTVPAGSTVLAEYAHACVNLALDRGILQLPPAETQGVVS
jgi:putative hydrolases of HD superfamily